MSISCNVLRCGPRYVILKIIVVFTRRLRTRNGYVPQTAQSSFSKDSLIFNITSRNAFRRYRISNLLHQRVYKALLGKDFAGRSAWSVTARVSKRRVGLTEIVRGQRKTARWGSFSVFGEQCFLNYLISYVTDTFETIVFSPTGTFGTGAEALAISPPIP